MAESIFWSIWEWLVVIKVFFFYFLFFFFFWVSVHKLSLSWDACFQGRHSTRHVKQSSLICPPDEILKLNFGGSFVRKLEKGDFGGVRRYRATNELSRSHST